MYKRKTGWLMKFLKICKQLNYDIMRIKLFTIALAATWTDDFISGGVYCQSCSIRVKILKPGVDRFHLIHIFMN